MKFLPPKNKIPPQKLQDEFQSKSVKNLSEKQSKFDELCYFWGHAIVGGKKKNEVSTQMSNFVQKIRNNEEIRPKSVPGPARNSKFHPKIRNSRDIRVKDEIDQNKGNCRKRSEQKQ
jgi:hypothetical protein